MADDGESTTNWEGSGGQQKVSATVGGETSRNSSLERVQKPAHEQSPLLSAAATEHEEEEERGLISDSTVLNDDRDDFENRKSLWYMILLTISIGGLQLAWAVEISNGTPYLLSLGMSKSLMALVWIAGPLSGTLVQPYVGLLSDNCRSSWGKRRPFMAAGTVATIVSLLALAWVREMVGGFLALFGADRESQGVKTTIIVVAILFVYILDFSINTVQAGIRAFILDCAPSHQQEAANSMASRVVGVGNIIGYVAGYVDLPKYVWFFGNTQFKGLSVIACLALGSTVALSSGAIKERDPRIGGPPAKGSGGVISFFKQVFRSIKRLPPQTRKVCEVQFFAWIGWFPQLFYSSSYIGDIYVQPFLAKNPNMTPGELDRLYEDATRVGTFALLIYAISSLATNVLLPFMVAPTFDNPTSSSSKRSQKRYSTRMSRLLDSVIIPWLTLRRAWLISHLIFAICMFSTLIVRSIGAATTLIGVVGVSWAVTLWAPFAIISAEVSKRDALRRSRKSPLIMDDADDTPVDEAGVILGIHNVSIAAPQILATVGSSIIFKFLQKPRGTPGDRSIPVVLAVAALSTLVAAYLTSTIKDEVEISDVVVEEGRHANTGQRLQGGAVENRPLMREEQL